jgi:hypothetical protein
VHIPPAGPTTDQHSPDQPVATPSTQQPGRRQRTTSQVTLMRHRDFEVRLPVGFNRSVKGLPLRSRAHVPTSVALDRSPAHRPTPTSTMSHQRHHQPRSPTMPIRYPLAAIHYRNLSDLARITGYPLRTINRWKANGIPRYSADRLAIRLGLHPASIWTTWYAGWNRRRPTAGATTTYDERCTWMRSWAGGRAPVIPGPTDHARHRREAINTAISIIQTNHELPAT